MQYVCIKSLSVGGTTYHPGDTIPDGVILSTRAGRLKKSGYISETGTEDVKESRSGGTNVSVIPIDVIQKKENNENTTVLSIPVTAEEIQDTFNIMQMTVEDGARAIAELESENVRILLRACESRRGIRKAVEVRLGSDSKPETDDTESSHQSQEGDA